MRMRFSWLITDKQLDRLLEERLGVVTDSRVVLDSVWIQELVLVELLPVIEQRITARIAARVT